MHIDDLIRDIKPHIPFRSGQATQEFINRLGKDDRIALISAMYIGRSHIHSNEINDDHINSGEMNRYWERKTIFKTTRLRVFFMKKYQSNYLL
jgi:hypothetical protein